MKRLYTLIILVCVRGIQTDANCPTGSCSSQDDCTGQNEYCTQCVTDPSVRTCECRPGYTGSDCSGQDCSAMCGEGRICSPAWNPATTQGTCKCTIGKCGQNCEGPSTVVREGTASGYYFEFTCDTGSQDEAKQFCELEEGWLVEFKSQKITDDVAVILDGVETFIYSGLQKNSTGEWTWTDGTTPSSLAYENWGDESGTNERGGDGGCMAFTSNYEWYDWECGRSEEFLCQYSACSSQEDCTGLNEYCTQWLTNPSVTTCKCRPGYNGSDCSVQGCVPECQDKTICTPPWNPSGNQGFLCKCPIGSCGENCDGPCSVFYGGTAAGYYFELTRDTGTQDEAKQFCELRGGWLVEFKSEEITNGVSSILNGLETFIYTGLEKKSDGAWMWKDGTSPSTIPYENWWQGTGDIGGEGGCMTFDSTYQWFDWECGRLELFLCQYPPCSASDHCNDNQYCVQSEIEPTSTYCKCKPGYYGANVCSEQYCDPKCSDSKVCDPKGNTSDGYICKCSLGYCGENCDDDSNVIGSGTAEGYFFELTCDNANQEEAKNFCETNGGWLSEPKTQAISDGIKNILDGKSAYYYTYLKKSSSGEWQWNDDAEVSATYSNWSSDEPGGPIGGTGNCMAHDSDMAWYDWDCGRLESFVCQYVDICASLPCENGGTCTTTGINTYSCTCANGFDGDNCENDICDIAMPCENGGSCSSTTPNIYLCSCTTGYYGENCTDEICDAAKPCQNGGTCDNIGPNTYNCSCSTGYYGKNCTDEICEVAVPCQNGGTCSNTGPNTYSCNCSTSYYGKNCIELLEISSPSAATGVANDDLTIELNITTSEGNISVRIFLDDETKTVLENNDNGTITYPINNVTLDDEGIYTFMAYPESDPYTTNTTTNVTVHVRAFIEDMESYYIYAPQSDNQGCERTITCTVGGIPTPDYGWYRNNSILVDSPQNNVYQDFGVDSTTLYVKNANRSDAGQYICLATNKVADESDESRDDTFITLAIYGAPTEVNPVGKYCSEVGEITVYWAPEANTGNVNHTFTISAVNGTMEDYDENITAVAGTDVTFTSLMPSTKYRVYVEVCPEIGCCIRQLNNSGYATTGHGQPDKVASAGISKTSNIICEVTWTPPDTFVDQVEGYNITWTESIKYAVENDVEDVLRSTSVGSSDTDCNLEMSPNRQYTVTVSARSCAGNGPERGAVGECFTDKAGPNEVPSATVSDSKDKDRQPTRNVTVPMIDDESNGAVSCVFVVLYKGNSQPIGPPTLSDLEVLSSNAMNKQNLNQGYLAKALKRNEITIGEAVNLTLGDDTDSQCDVFVTQTKSGDRKRRDMRDVTSITAANIPLDYNGVTYIMITTTTTPVNESNVALVNSPGISFQQGIYVASLIAVYVLVPLVIIIAAALAVWIYYRRKTRKQRGEGSSQMRLSNKHLADITEGGTSNTYANVMTTTIALKDLLNCYISMEANECMMFREQYGELRQKAKQMAPSSAYASSEQVMMKNRYRNILPYDTNRVHLQGDGAETYINASYIAGHKKKFIATQGPLPHTITDFWRMIVEQGCRIIVMLTKCDEMGRRKCEKYWPSANKAVSYGSYEIVNVMEKELGGIVKRVMKVHVPGQGEFRITQYHYVRWPDHGVPLTTSTFFRLHKQVMAEYQSLKEESPIVVHCSAGVGRTGTFVGFDIMMGQIKNSVDIYNCVMDMRKQRVDMVQTSEQYQMLHKLILENHLFKNDDIEAKDLPKKRKNLNVNEDLRNLRQSESLNSKSQDGSAGSRTKVVIVRQPEDTEWVTINATFVEAYKECINFIASEGPSNSTVEYFLRALWDNQVNAIVMLNNPAVDKMRSESQYCEYWPTNPGQALTYNSITITHKSEHEIRGTIERKFQLERRNQQPREVTQYQYPGWTNDDPPENGDGIIDLIARINAIDLGKPAIVLVHCTDGLGKTGVFIAVANSIERLKGENRVDIFRTVKDLRDIRPGIVKSQGDYQRCYDITMYFSSQQNTYENSGFQKEEQESEVKDPIYENL